MTTPASNIYETGFTPTQGQRQIIENHSGDLQVIACAGSGKTESISRRVAEILRCGALPESVVAFTFTEKAACELKERITRHVRRVMGEQFLGTLGRMYVGTIHGYCYRILTEHKLELGNHDILDEHQHQAFVHRHRKALNLEALARDATGRRVPGFEAASLFISAVDTMGNDLIPESALAGHPIAVAYATYRSLLDQHRFLTFGLIISEAVHSLESVPAFRASVRAHLQHLLVDEYQDVNPAQERLIDLLTDTPRPAEHPVCLCVVGDDDQAIYQWRGSDVANILQFEPRQRGRGRTVSVARLTDNRRSVPAIVTAANTFASSIASRLPKQMQPTRPAASPALACWSAETDEEEAATLARHIQALHAQGRPYSQCAILLRSVKTSGPAIVAALEALDIPFNCGGRTGLFINPEIDAFGELFSWISDSDWRDGARYTRPGEPSPWRPAAMVAPGRLLAGAFGLSQSATDEFLLYLADWKKHRLSSGGKSRISFVGDLYRILDTLGIGQLRPDTSPAHSARLGAYARFSRILADFESIAFRGRKHAVAAASPGGPPEFKFIPAAGTPAARNKIVWGSLANFLLNYAKDAYEDFEGETATSRDEVSIFTVHQAKGLEWPVVFLPCLTTRRFPSIMTGRAQTWLLPESCFSQAQRARYEGCDADERRLFYVALTRARDIAYLSHARRKTNALSPSPYLLEIAGPTPLPILNSLPLPVPPAPSPHNPEPVQVSFSDLADHEHCGHGYRLAQIFGFKPEVTDELGYGRAVHHVLRTLAERHRATGTPPTDRAIDRIVEAELFVPFANNATYGHMLHRVKSLVRTYIRSHAQDLARVWATERPFEMRFPAGLVAGRADVILDQETSLLGSLAIVDYKVNADPARDARYARQLQVYAAAARDEGLTIDALYLHSLRGDRREPVAHQPAFTQAAVAWAASVVDAIAAARFPACGDPSKCAGCDFLRLCHSRQAAPTD